MWDLWWTKWFSPVSIIPPMPHTHLHLHVAFTRMTNGRSLPEGIAPSGNPLHWTDLRFSNFFFSRTTANVQNISPYHWVLQILIPAFRILVFQDLSPVRKFEVFKRVNQRNNQRCGKLKFRSCNFSNLTRLADRGEPVFIFEQWNSIFIYAL